MIHCLDDSGKPISILDLCGYPHDVAVGMLLELHKEMSVNMKRWERQPDDQAMPGVRVILEYIQDKHPLEDPRKHHYGLHPDFDFMTCWFCRVSDREGPFEGLPRLMFIVRPMDERIEAALNPAPEIEKDPNNALVGRIGRIPIIRAIIDATRLVSTDKALNREERT